MSITISGKKRADVEPVVRELDDVKRLLIMLLLKAGSSQGEIASALDMDQGNLSRTMKARDYKPFPGVAAK